MKVRVHVIIATVVTKLYKVQQFYFIKKSPLDWFKKVFTSQLKNKQNNVNRFFEFDTF